MTSHLLLLRKVNEPPGEMHSAMGFGKDGKGAIIKESLSVGLLALGGNDVIIFTGPTNIEEDFRIIKTEAFCHVTGLTANEGQALQLGLSNGNLAASDIEASIEAGGPLNPSDRLRAEPAERLTKMFGGTGNGARSQTTEVGFVNENGGPQMAKTVRWTFSNTENWSWFIHNLGAVLTTGATARLIATHYGVWVQ